jgi:DNA mismatch repair ATPase MutS
VVADRDIAGMNALRDLRGRGISVVADVVSQSADHVHNFLLTVQRELAFYLGCINVHRELLARDAPVSFPTPTGADTTVFACEGLYDVALRLLRPGSVVANDVEADGRTLLMITGANQGGKSTFLRRVGAAQLMMQCGMFVPAASFRANAARTIFTHFKREEDAAMHSGKLDEELARMSAIVDRITPGSMLLSNESFASTNEREGSEIARNIFEGLLDSGVKVVAVTHLFDLANSLFQSEPVRSLFLRAEREADGSRTFRLAVGAPGSSSHGEDVYRQVFGFRPSGPATRNEGTLP